MRSKKEILLNSDLIELLGALEKYDVKYMIIGGHAVGFHVEPRFTKDFDIWTSTTKRNARAIYRALAEFGAPLKHYTPKDFEEDGHFYQFGEYPNRVDVLMGPPGPKFASAWRSRIETEIGGQKAIYVGRKALIELKAAAGRPIDRRDLRAIHESNPFAVQDRRERKAPSAKKQKARSAHKRRRATAPAKK